MWLQFKIQQAQKHPSHNLHSCFKESPLWTFGHYKNEDSKYYYLRAGLFNLGPVNLFTSLDNSISI